MASTPWVTLGVTLTCKWVNSRWSSLPCTEDSTIFLTDVINYHTVSRQCTSSVLVVNEEFHLIAIVVNVATRSRRTGVNTVVANSTRTLACTCEELGKWLGHISCISQIDTRVAIRPVSNIEITLTVHRHTSWVTETCQTTLISLSILFSQVMIILPNTTFLTSGRARRTSTVHYINLTEGLCLWVSIHRIEQTRCARLVQREILCNDTKVSNCLTSEVECPGKYITLSAWQHSCRQLVGVSALLHIYYDTTSLYTVLVEYKSSRLSVRVSSIRESIDSISQCYVQVVC